MTAPFRIAPARVSDLADVAALFRAYAESLPVDLSHQGFADELERLPGAYAPPKGTLLLARAADGTALGVIGLRPLTEDGVAEVKRLYVRPQARGLGLGRALVAALLEEAARLGHREVRLDTLPHMESAIALYRSFGFAPVAPYGSYPFEGLLCFGRRLAPA